MLGWHPVDALSFQTTPINPLLSTSRFQRRIGRPLPLLTNEINGLGVGKPDHNLAGFRVFIPNNEMSMMVPLVGLLIRPVNSSQPAGPACRHTLGKATNKLNPLRVRQLMRQGQHDLRNNATVLAITGFLFVQPAPGFTTT